MANDFSGDPNCVALWKFDNNVNDSKGGNDLTAVNSPSYDSGDKKEGTHCIDLEKGSTQYGTIDDGDLDAGFPGKSGTSEQSLSICCWVKFETLDGINSQGLVDKYGSGTRSFAVRLSGALSKILFTIGYNGGASSTDIIFDTACVTGRWYHVGVVYDSSDNSMKLRIWDDTAGALLDNNKAGTAGGDMSPDTAPLQIGRDYELDGRVLDGKVDEVVIFKDVLTDDEIDQIRAGTYGAVTEKESSDTGTGTDAVESLQTPQAKTSSDAGAGAEGAPTASAILAGSESGSGIEALISRMLADNESGSAIEAADVEGEGQPKDISVSEPAEGADRLVAKIEIPTKGGGMRLWT
jgi:hypothetical protein